MALLYGLCLRLANVVLFFLLIILLPGLPPQTSFPYKEFIIAPTKELKGALEPNLHLEGAERLLEGRVYGPECLIARKNEIYTGIHGGEIIKLSGEHVTHVAKLGQPCEDITEESRCGRPLGLAFDTIGNNLIVADAYYGLWQVDLSNGRKKLLVSPQQELQGKQGVRKAKFFNNVAVDKKGDIYWTDSSSDFVLQDLVYIAFANPSGRLFKYDRVKNVSKLLLDELYFTNGVALSPMEDFVVVAETGNMRLLKYHLKGAKAGQSEVFAEGLPGNPDNITPDADGLWVPLIVAVDSEHPSTFSMLSRFPNLRLFLARLLRLFELPFQLLQNAYPNKICERAIHFIGNADSISLLRPKRATIVRLDWNGNIVGSLHGFDQSVGAVSHVLELNDQLYLGSPWNRFMARVRSPKPSSKQPTIKVRNVRYEGAGMEASVKLPNDGNAKPVPVAKPITTTTVRPTTTTRRPATTTAAPTTTTSTTTTTTQRPKTSSTTTTTRKPTTAPTKATPTPIPPTTTAEIPTGKKRVPPKQSAPIKEEIPSDTKPPKPEKLKVISKTGEHVEL